MPTKRDEKRVIVSVTPETLQPKVALMEQRIDDLRQQYDSTLTMAQVESRVILARSELDRVSEELEQQGAAASGMIKEADEKIRADRESFERACQAQKRALEESAEQFNVQAAARTAAAIQKEREIENRLAEISKIEAELQGRETALSAMEAALVIREKRLEESENALRIQGNRVADLLHGTEERAKILTRAEAMVRDQKAWIESADKGIREREVKLRDEVVQIAHMKKEAASLKAKISDEAVALSGRIQAHRDELESFKTQKSELLVSQNELSAKARRLSENDQRQTEREARILKLEATIRDEERRLEYAKEQVRQDMVRLENAKRKA